VSTNLLRPFEGINSSQPRRTRWMSVRLFVVACVLVLLATAGTAIGIGMNFVDDQARLDANGLTPPEMRPVGPRAEVAAGEDWSFMTWRSEDGFCIAYASGSAGDAASSCGHIPAEGARVRSRYLVAALNSPAAASDGLGGMVGLVMPLVARIKLELADGTTKSTLTLPALPILGTDLRAFIIRAELAHLPVGPGTPPLVRAYNFFAADGQLLERVPVG
jgi:hypothetical protein